MKSLRKKTAMLISIIISLFIFILTYIILDTASIDNLQKDLSKNCVRLHIIANSNKASDQKIKLYVRDNLIDYINTNFDLTQGKQQILDEIIKHKEDIERFIKKVLEKKGIAIPVKLLVTKAEFPNRIYDGFLFPAGAYDAVKIELGEAKGKNWWCVIFPPLCFVDETKVELPDSAKNELKKELSKSEYKLAIYYGSMDKMPVKLKIKIYEVLKTRFYKEAWFKKIFKNL
ncbi:stage II sporulation protein R [Caldicellulosiruptoraceae bacterium PP1]